MINQAVFDYCFERSSCWFTFQASKTPVNQQTCTTSSKRPAARLQERTRRGEVSWRRLGLRAPPRWSANASRLPTLADGKPQWRESLPSPKGMSAFGSAYVKTCSRPHNFYAHQLQSRRSVWMLSKQAPFGPSDNVLHADCLTESDGAACHVNVGDSPATGQVR